MERVVIHFIDENKHFINIEATDIYKCDDYLQVYNGEDLVCVVLISSVKTAYKISKST